MVLETTIEGNSSKFEEKAEPMEVSSGIVNPWPTKRKAELDPEESEDEIEEAGDGKAEIDYSESDEEMLKVPEWDVGSFDGVEYYSSPEPEFSDDDSNAEEWKDFCDNNVEAIKDYSIYKRQIIESHGFYADPELRPSAYYNQIKPKDLECVGYKDQTYREYWGGVAEVCLQKYDQQKNKNVEFVRMVRGFYGGASILRKTYITFLAREKPDEPPVEYQAKFVHTFDGKNHPILCRPAPTPKP